MRRIPRPQRAIDPSLPSPSILRHQLPPTSCLRVASPYPHLRTTSAPFSTTPTVSFLLGKYDKKSHQQSVRRWQKRLLGDSEPIGSRVDPYDPTSPVRIAPEEQGEELEVLEEALSEPSVDLGPVYEEAQTWDRLRHVGGEEWIEQLEEGKLAKEYEKLTMKTYTPLDLKMADQIEDLTGSMYTLRDENLMMATAFHEFTGKPYTDWSFGRRTRVRSPDALRKNFHRAVIEIYALKQAGKNLDISRLPNRGIYDAPGWIKDVKLQKLGDSDFVLSIPGKRSLETLLEEMQHVPEYVTEQQRQDLQEKFLAEEGEELTVEQPEPPVMDPETPAYRRAALVKQDAEKRFDFMSNRPVPRAPPVEPVAEPAETVKETVVVESKVDPVAVKETIVEEVEVEPKPASSSQTSTDTPAVGSPTTEMLESSALATEQNIAALREAVRDSVIALSSKSIERITPAEVETKWRHVPLTDLDIKFALTKRFTQLTGLYISDPSLTGANTLGDLYHHFCVAAKPELAKVHKFIQVEGSKENRKANQLAQSQSTRTRTQRSRPHVGELLKLGNVQVLSKRPTAKDERKKIGLHKAIRRELKKRDLLDNKRMSRQERLERAQEAQLRKKETNMIEGTRVAPQFGTVVALEAAHLLKQRTERKKVELLGAQVGRDDVVNQLLRERNLAPEGGVA
ncbi:hypothetical protein K458DRAFT_333133 [Lentithecium fluviatile CBS 122367]|uniref:Large ribosomal subunit protein mL50 n=1 Tax=Lentithecium fluviatile CBS 122367 TaxID=1168545 RepID=A0A6G1JA22_9PLEO|nr:hypothetical protein K458DRAFT_333133 [Lentithecium fluviatile CBS 122367]